MIAAVFALLGAAPAHGQTGIAEVVPVRVFAGWLVYRSYTRVDQLVVWNAPTGSVARLFCLQPRERGRPRPCPGLAGYDQAYTVDFTVPSSGMLDLTRHVRRARLLPARGQRTAGRVGVNVYAGPPDSSPIVNKDLVWDVRRRALPRITTRDCYRDPGFVEVECASPCPPPPILQFSNYCEGAGQLLPLPRFSAASRAARGGGVRITRLRVSNLPLQPPFDNPAIGVFCRGRGCPFGGRFFATPPGGVLDVRSFGRRRLRPGTVIELAVIKGNLIGRVQRYEVTRRRLVASRRCLYPTRERPQACPPG